MGKRLQDLYVAQNWYISTFSSCAWVLFSFKRYYDDETLYCGVGRSFV